MYLKIVNVITFKMRVAFINFYQFIFCNILKINNKIYYKFN